RGAFTPEDTRRNPKAVEEPFLLHLRPGAELKELERHSPDDKEAMRITFLVPANSKEKIEIVFEHDVRITTPPGQVPQQHGPGLYEFPKDSVIRTEAVSRWDLATVIALAVAIICIWGTFIGSTLPLIFRWIGIDPGFASSPFVATFVDVTGIVIYFSIAKTIFGL